MGPLVSVAIALSAQHAVWPSLLWSVQKMKPREPGVFLFPLARVVAISRLIVTFAMTPRPN